MTIWSTEIKDIEQVSKSLNGALPNLEKELGKLIHSDDENMILVYSRRCLEVIITDLCENELNRQRGTEPLQRIIDKLNKEQKVPHNIIISMLGVNSMSAFGAHPKEYDTRQLKPVLSNLTTILEWYLLYKNVDQIEKSDDVELWHPDNHQKTSKTNSIDSLVILPFDNFTGNESLDYFVSGMHSSLIGDMGQISGLRVIGKTSSNVYKNTEKSISTITSELHVDAAIESEVLSLGDSVCVQIKLISTYPEEKQLWFGKFNEDKSRILSLYNNVTKKIAEEVKVQLTPDEEKRLSESRLVNREAYDEYLKAHSYWGDGSRESLQKAREYLNNAIQKEPDWAPLYSGLAQVWLVIQQMGFEQPSIAAPEIFRNLDKAFELDSDLSEAHFLKALIAQLVEWDWEKSEKEFLKALAVNPSDARSRMLYAQLLCVLQRTDEAKIHGDLAYNLDPFDPYMKIWYGAILPVFDECKTAVAIAEEITAADPGNYIANNGIVIGAFLCKDYKKVIQAEKKVLPVFNIEEDDIREIEMIFNKHGIVRAYEKIMEHLEKYAENSTITFMDMAMRYIIAAQPDKALDWVERGFKEHDPQTTYIGTKIYTLEPLFKNPRFVAILEKMNLPLPKNNNQ